MAIEVTSLLSHTFQPNRTRRSQIGCASWLSNSKAIFKWHYFFFSPFLPPRVEQNIKELETFSTRGIWNIIFLIVVQETEADGQQQQQLQATADADTKGKNILI